MKRFKKIMTIMVITIIVIVANVAVNIYNNSEFSDSEEIEETTETTEEDDTADSYISTVTLVAVGDVINHDAVLEMALQDDGTYDFSNLFANVKEYIQSADVALVNCESIIGGLDGGYSYGGYPDFNSPDELGDALIDAGFDIILQANNHVLDAGVAGIKHCLSYWESNSDLATVIGINSSQEDQDTIEVQEINGIKIAFLNYTFSMNGNTLSKKNSYLVNVMDDTTWDDVQAQIEEADELADIVVVCPHWGTEYVVGDTTDEQDEWAEMFVEAGADLIIGTHPHVIEPIEVITADNGNTALCYYSLGNFTSNQANSGDDYANYTQLGGMAVVQIVEDEDGEIYIDLDSSGVVPIVCQNDTEDGINITAYRLEDYTSELCSVHAAKLNGYKFSLKWLNSLAEEVFGDWIISWP